VRIGDKHSGKYMFALCAVVIYYRTVTQILPRTCAKPDWIFDQPALDLGMERRHTLVVKRHFTTNKHI